MIERLHTDNADALALIEALRVYIPIVMAKHQTPGINIALADKGRLVWEAGFGLADIATQAPVTPDHVYHSGSLGKTYTATAIMILVDRGVIALDDPINRHLPFEVHNPLGERDITVRDLMVHKAGLSGDGASSQWAPAASLVDTLKMEYAQPVSPMAGGLMPRWASPVGTSWAYSNLGLATLGLIVETANPEKLSFAEFVQRHVMDPLGMTHSQYPVAQHPDFARAELLALATTGYSRMGMADIPTLPVYFAEYPAGGVLARPADHVRLMLAMMNGGELDGYRLFSPEIAKAMISPATAMPAAFPERDERGYAFEQGLIWRINDHGWAWESFDHGGGHMFGWRTQGRAWPTYGTAVMVACNQWSLPDSSMESIEIPEFVSNWLRHRSPAVPASRPSAAALSYARGAMLAGSYRVMVGIPGTPAAHDVEAMAAGTRDRGGDWDAAAFLRGWHAAYAIEPTIAAFQAFWSSPASEIDADTARAAFAAMQGPAASLVAPLLPPAG